ncbi:MAG: Translation initiation factor 1A [Alectoria fallacina]|uniref:Translation initiation factor 1A n=1 Tax=Alectoria fallacina TaxID=1903189 RepID=A0A8H3EN10_9LECA|nr:MAG: Translation initiation factor 1A [Alectoria fallacina]
MPKNMGKGGTIDVVRKAKNMPQSQKYLATAVSKLSASTAIRRKLRKKIWINQGDIIHLSLRDYQDEKGDVILKYTKINETDTYGHEGVDDNFEFDEDRDNSSDDKDIDVDEI